MAVVLGAALETALEKNFRIPSLFSDSGLVSSSDGGADESSEDSSDDMTLLRWWLRVCGLRLGERLTKVERLGWVNGPVFRIRLAYGRRSRSSSTLQYRIQELGRIHDV